MAKSYAQRNAESLSRTGKSLYERRVESGLSRGLSPQQSRGHARSFAATGYVRPIPSGYVKNIRGRTDNRVLGQQIHAKQASTFRRQLEKMSDGTGVLIRLYGNDGSITAKGSGKGGGVRAGDLKGAIEVRMEDYGMTWEEAFADSIIDVADSLYDDTSDQVDYVPSMITDFVAYTMY